MRFLQSLSVVVLLGLVMPAFGAAETPAPAASASASTNATLRELERLIQQIQSKLNEGKRTESDLAAELKEFDGLLGKSGKTDEGAQVLAMKAMLYAQVFDDLPKAKDLFKKVMSDYPRSPAAQQSVQIVANIERIEDFRKIQQSLVVGAKFPDFQEKDIEGKALSLSQYQGKVVLVDFWATWCGPCRMELPNVIATYQKHHKNGFEIVGISLDQDADTMKNFTKTSGMSWQQFFDGQLWQNKLAQQYGIMSIPATFLLDRQGKIIGRDLRGPELEQAVAAALAKK